MTVDWLPKTDPLSAIYNFTDKFFKFLSWSFLTAIIKKVAESTGDVFFFGLFGVCFILTSSWMVTLFTSVVIDMLHIPVKIQSGKLLLITGFMVVFSISASVVIQRGMWVMLDKVILLQKLK